jgi:hypothetical protein
MTLPPDERVIDPDAPQYNATLVRREDMTDDLAYFWVKYDGDPVPFEPGQYMTTGVFADGKMWLRAGTSSTSGWSRSSGSRRCSGACRSDTGCG